MELIIVILGCASLGHMGADVLSKFDWLWDQPFKCNMCLTFWMCIVPLMVEYGVEGILIAALSSIVSELIFKIINRL